jgi:hypothetical protein
MIEFGFRLRPTLSVCIELTAPQRVKVVEPVFVTTQKNDTSFRAITILITTPPNIAFNLVIESFCFWIRNPTT